MAIASEVRTAWQCLLCKERKDALSPYAISGDHDRVSTLPEAALDVIHRVSTDSGRLCQTWYDEILASGQISDGRYFEIIDVLIAIVSIDSFCHGIGVPLHPLPESEQGFPSQYRPAAAQLETAWVPTIPSGQATGAEADLYGESGHGANVIRALSLIPDPSASCLTSVRPITCRCRR